MHVITSDEIRGILIKLQLIKIFMRGYISSLVTEIMQV